MCIYNIYFNLPYRIHIKQSLFGCSASIAYNTQDAVWYCAHSKYNRLKRFKKGLPTFLDKWRALIYDYNNVGHQEYINIIW